MIDWPALFERYPEMPRKTCPKCNVEKLTGIAFLQDDEPVANGTEGFCLSCRQKANHQRNAHRLRPRGGLVNPFRTTIYAHTTAHCAKKASRSQI